MGDRAVRALMRKLAEHHPARRIERPPGRPSRMVDTEPAPRVRQTYVREFILSGWSRPFGRSSAASNAIWDRSTRPGPYRPDAGGYVGEKKLPKHRYLPRQPRPKAL